MFCSLWTTFRRIDGCANLFLNNKLSDDYFFNRLNGLQSCGNIDRVLDKVSKICLKNKQNVSIHVPSTSDNYVLMGILLKKGFRFLDSMYTLKINKPLVTKSGRNNSWHPKIVTEEDLKIWIQVFCESFSIRNWEQEVSRIIKRSFNRLILIVAYIPGQPKNPVGCMSLFKYQNIIGLYCLGTLRPFRRKGLATNLVQFANLYGKQMNMEFLIVHSLASENTINLYKNLGFDIVQVKKIFVSGSLILGHK